MHSKTEKIFKILPSLRRYAHALAGTEAGTDDVLESAIEWMIDNSLLDHENFESLGVASCRISWLADESGDVDIINPSTMDDDHISTTEAITQALAKLPFYARQCLVLTAVEGKSYHEIATLENIPSSVVGDYVAQARTTLAKILLTATNTAPKPTYSSLKWCSDRHLNALLDDELSSAEASHARNAIGFDGQLSQRLEQLAVIDTLVVSHVAENNTAPFHSPLHMVVTQASAYLH